MTADDWAMSQPIALDEVRATFQIEDAMDKDAAAGQFAREFLLDYLERGWLEARRRPDGVLSYRLTERWQAEAYLPSAGRAN